MSYVPLQAVRYDRHGARFRLRTFSQTRRVKKLDWLATPFLTILGARAFKTTFSGETVRILAHEQSNPILGIGNRRCSWLGQPASTGRDRLLDRGEPHPQRPARR